VKRRVLIGSLLLALTLGGLWVWLISSESDWRAA
jgi:hypothetical protein